MDQMNQLETAENVSGFDLFIQQGFIIENQHKLSLKKLIKQNYQYIIHLKQIYDSLVESNRQKLEEGQTVQI